jgi:hypothetical protein
MSVLDPAAPMLRLLCTVIFMSVLDPIAHMLRLPCT